MEHPLPNNWPYIRFTMVIIVMGSHIIYNFRVTPGAAYHLDNEPSINMFPARTQGPVTLDYFANEEKEVKVIITQQEDETKIVETHTYLNFKKGILTY